MKHLWTQTLLLLVTAAAAGCAQNFAAANRQAAEQPQKLSVEQRLAMARIAEGKNEFRAAAAIYQEILNEDPNQFDALHGMALIAARRADFENADAYFQKAYALNPNHVELLNDIGYMLYLQNRLDEAESVLRRAAAESPGHHRANNNLAMVLGQKGDFHAAFNLFAHANGTAAAYNNMAFVHYQRAEFDKAKELYARALDHDARLQPAASALLQMAHHERGRSSHAAQSTLPPMIESMRPVIPSTAPPGTPPMTAAQFLPSVQPVAHQAPASPLPPIGAPTAPAASQAVHTAGTNQPPEACPGGACPIPGQHAAHQQHGPVAAIPGQPLHDDRPHAPQTSLPAAAPAAPMAAPSPTAPPVPGQHSSGVSPAGLPAALPASPGIPGANAGPTVLGPSNSPIDQVSMPLFPQVESPLRDLPRSYPQSFDGSFLPKPCQ